MSHPVDRPGSSSDEPTSERPRPSWGQPAPDEPTVASDPSPTTVYGQPGQRPYGEATGGARPTPSYGQPAQPPTGQPQYGQPQYGQPQYGQPQGQPQYGQPGYGQTPSSPPQGWPQQGWSEPSPAQYGQDLRQHEHAYAQMYGQKPRTGFAIASMVLGILAFLGCWIPFLSYAAVIMALLAVIFGVIAVRRPSGRGMAVTGLVLGGIALVASVFFSIFYTRFFVDAAQVAQDCANENPSLGRAYEQCVTDRSTDLIPFQ